jgi:beta-glucanase (GH16 family)
MSSNLTPPSGYSTSDLVFNDSFTGTSLNSAIWNTYITSNGTQGAPWNATAGGGSGPSGTIDVDYDEPSQVTVNNGLNLTAIQKSVDGANWVNNQEVSQTFPITSGAVSSYGKFEFTGGYLQISMKQPAGDGEWSSLWLLPGSGAGSVGNNFEIDMQEGGYLQGSNNPNNVEAYHLHTPSGTFGDGYISPTDLTSGFHTYGIDWEPGKSITWYLDGKQIAEVTSADEPIPNEPMEVIMSNQVANSSTSSWHTAFDSSTPQSMDMQIADVQLYQKAGSGDTVLGGNQGSSGGTSAPTVAITNAGGSVTTASQTINGTVDLADAGSTVKVLDGSTQIGSAVVASNGDWSANVTLSSQGNNVLTATDANAAGTGVSNAVTFDLVKAAGVPSVTITNWGGTVATAKQTINGAVDVADAGTTVKVLDGSTQIGSAVVASNGDWSAKVTLDALGSNVLTATDANGAGTGTSNAVTFDYEPATPPTLTVAHASLNVTGGGGTVALGINESAPSYASDVLLTIRGLPSYETISDHLGDTFRGPSIQLTGAEVASGLTLTSSYTGNQHPVATLTLSARDTIRGSSYTAATQTITVTDPPPATTNQLGLSLHDHIAAGSGAALPLQDASTWAHHDAFLAVSQHH